MNLIYRWFLPLCTSTLSNKSVLVNLHTFRCSPTSGVVKFPCKYTRHKTVAKYFVEGEWLSSIWNNEVVESHIIGCGDRTAHCDIFKLRRVRFFPFWRHELQISYRASQYALLSVPMCSYTCQVEKAVPWLAQSAWSRELWTRLKTATGFFFSLFTGSWSSLFVWLCLPRWRIQQDSGDMLSPCVLWMTPYIIILACQYQLH